MEHRGLKITYVVSFIALVLGLILLLVNMKNLKASVLLDENYADDKAFEVQQTCEICSYSYDWDDAQFTKNMFKHDVRSGNTAFVGIGIASAAFISLIVCFSISMKNKGIEAVQPPKTLENRLTELSSLKERHLISNEEYERLRSEAIWGK